MEDTITHSGEMFQMLKLGPTISNICDLSTRNESHVGSVQVEKMGNMHDMG